MSKAKFPPKKGSYSKRFIRFLVVGVCATALHYAVMAVLFTAFDMAATLSSTAGFLLSAVFNYSVNRTFTFESTQLHTTGAPRFVITAVLGMVLNYFLLSVLLVFGAGVMLAQILSTIGVTAWNYCIHSVWTFKTARV